MKKENKIIKVFRYFSLLLVIALGLVSIIGTGGGSGGGGGGNGDSQTYMPLPNTDGDVLCMARSENILYIGGDFTRINVVAKGAALDNATGKTPAGVIAPRINGTVSVAVPDGSGGWYIGGSFTNIEGETRNNIARINSDGSLHDWDPNANGTVWAIAVSDTDLYAAGYFTSIGGETRNYITAIDTSTGNATQWDPNANNVVLAIAVSGTNVYAGGYFSHIGGETRNRIAAIDTSTGNATTWNPNSNRGAKRSN